MPSIDIDSIGINPHYAKVLKISEKDTVTLTPAEKNISKIISLTLSPINKNDYDILVNIIKLWLVRLFKILIFVGVVGTSGRRNSFTTN